MVITPVGFTPLLLGTLRSSASAIWSWIRCLRQQASRVFTTLRAARLTPLLLGEIVFITGQSIGPFPLESATLPASGDDGRSTWVARV